MALTAAEIIKADQEHLIHPLHHPIDHAEPMIYVRGKGATIETLGGERYIDGLAGLWNVNVGHGRAELAEAAAAQMKELAYFSAYTGSSNLPAVQLAEKLIGLAYDNMQAVFFTCGGAESNESAFKTARFYWKTKGKPDKIKVISRHNAYHGVTQQAMPPVAAHQGAVGEKLLTGRRQGRWRRAAPPRGTAAPGRRRAAPRGR